MAFGSPDRRGRTDTGEVFAIGDAPLASLLALPRGQKVSAYELWAAFAYDQGCRQRRGSSRGALEVWLALGAGRGRYLVFVAGSWHLKSWDFTSDAVNSWDFCVLSKLFPKAAGSLLTRELGRMGDGCGTANPVRRLLGFILLREEGLDMESCRQEPCLWSVVQRRLRAGCGHSRVGPLRRQWGPALPSPSPIRLLLGRSGSL